MQPREILISLVEEGGGPGAPQVILECTFYYFIIIYYLSMLSVMLFTDGCI